MSVLRVIVLCMALTVVAGCALGTISKVKELHQGMTTEQVKAVMGEPSSVQLINGQPVWRYSLHQPWVGWIPHYLVFNQENQLIGWMANMNEYYANQMMMMSALQSMQRSSQPAAAAARGTSPTTGGGLGGNRGNTGSWSYRSEPAEATVSGDGSGHYFYHDSDGQSWSNY